MRLSSALLACLALSCGGSSATTTVTPEPVRAAGATAAREEPPRDEAPTPRPEPPRFPHGEPELSRLQAQLDAALSSPEVRGLTTGLCVVDAATGALVAHHDEGRALVPASNTKLFTTFAALRALGPAARAKLTVSIAGSRKAGRVEALVIDGGAAPFGPPFEPLDGAFVAASRALLRQGVRRVDRLVIETPAVVAPERFAELDLVQHRDRTAEALRKAFGRAGVAVGRLAGEAPSPREPLVELEGPSIASWIAPVNQLSHNGFADALSMHLGHRAGLGASLAGGAAVVARELERAGVRGATLTDGSGLSRRNHVTARAIADLLLVAQRDEAFVASLSVSGEVGTLAKRLKDTPLAGHVHGKTGTLKEVIATSGYLDHPGDGRRYAFAFVTNGVREGGGPNVRAAHDRWLSTIAAAW
ncbi:MAG: D-alanyl-D-alanine carboxypeptidase [Polyangiaceae bacterium]|nr:D-alanyl-D-alanine carboxypeptidase [Polyangiaceae bacterium]